MNSKNIDLTQKIRWYIKKYKPLFIFSIFCSFLLLLLAGTKYIAI